MSAGDRTVAPKPKPLTRIYVLLDKNGEAAGVYPSKSAATIDAVGPRFRGECTIVTYKRGELVVFDGG